jgi:hypothetical protein
MAASSSWTSCLPGDRRAELLAFGGVPQAHLEGLAGETDRARGEREAPVVEGGQRDLHPAADLAEDGVVTDPDPLERDLGGVPRAQAELAVDLPADVPGGVLRDEEAGDALVLAVDDGPREDLGDRAEGAVGDEDLGAVDHPAVAVAHRPGRHLRRVGAGTGLGEAERAELAGGHARQPALLLLLGPPPGDALADEADVDGHERADRRVGGAELLDDDPVAGRVETGTAVLLGDRRAEDPELGQPRQQLAG